jgi:cysteine desulfurase
MPARIYADHAATTPVRDDVLAAMLPYFGAVGFNASSPYAEGRAARAALDDARASVARLLGASPREIVFTGSGSEADSLAILGTARAVRDGRRHAMTIATEHHAVLHAFDVLRDEGWDVTIMPVDESGRIEPDAFARAVRPETALVSVMLANNELGTVHPVAELARLARARAPQVVFHVDAVQTPGRLPLDVAALGVDLLSLSGHKFYGPKGVGMLYVRGGTVLAPVIVGGGQEHGLRAGTENVAGIVGFAHAFAAAVAELPAEAPRVRALRDGFEAAVIAAVPGARVNAEAAERLPNIASLAFPRDDAATLLVQLDLAGVAVSIGSACAAGATTPSHVLEAIGAPPWVRAGTIRFSFGKLTSGDDVERLVTIVSGLARARGVAGDEVGIATSGSASSHSEGHP